MATALVVFACCMSLTMTAQGKLDSVQHVREIVVVSKPAMREVVPSQKLNGELLERLSTHTVADALRYFSGIQLKDYGGVGGIKTVNIRSMGTHHLGISYDGVALGNAQNGQRRRSRSITVRRVPFSSLPQTSAMRGRCILGQGNRCFRGRRKEEGGRRIPICGSGRSMGVVICSGCRHCGSNGCRRR